MMGIMRFSRGFTLIELLVVIAIIGILSATILVSLNTARDKGATAAIKKELSNARRIAELYNDANGRSYDNVCSDVTVAGVRSIYPVLAKIAEQYNYTLNIETYTGASSRVTCWDTPTTWVAEAPLRGGAGFFCVDYRGEATTTATSRVTANDTVCN